MKSDLLRLEMETMNEHKGHFSMVSEISQDGLEHPIVGDEGTTERCEKFSTSEKVPI